MKKYLFLTGWGILVLNHCRDENLRVIDRAIKEAPRSTK
jgi:hypothetical protein